MNSDIGVSGLPASPSVSHVVNGVTGVGGPTPPWASAVPVPIASAMAAAPRNMKVFVVPLQFTTRGENGHVLDETV
jgi:hypothetical protein